MSAPAITLTLTDAQLEQITAAVAECVADVLAHQAPVTSPVCLGTDRRTYRRILRADPCSYCARRPAGTVDHITPVSQSGSATWENSTAACPVCNTEKGAESLLMFLLARREERVGLLRPAGATS